MQLLLKEQAWYNPSYAFDWTNDHQYSVCQKARIGQPINIGEGIEIVNSMIQDTIY